MKVQEYYFTLACLFIDVFALQSVVQATDFESGK